MEIIGVKALGLAASVTGASVHRRRSASGSGAPPLPLTPRVPAGQGGGKAIRPTPQRPRRRAASSAAPSFRSRKYCAIPLITREPSAFESEPPSARVQVATQPIGKHEKSKLLRVLKTIDKPLVATSVRDFCYSESSTFSPCISQLVVPYTSRTVITVYRQLSSKLIGSTSSLSMFMPGAWCRSPSERERATARAGE